MYGTTALVRIMLGRPWQSADEEALAAELLARAGRLIDEAVPAAAARATTDTAFAAAAADVAVDAVLRVVRDPEGWTIEAQDDWRGQRDADNVGGRLRLLPSEITRLKSWQATTNAAGVPGIAFVSFSG